MKDLLACVAPSLLLPQVAMGRTRIAVSEVIVTHGEHMIEGRDTAIELRGSQGSGSTVLLQRGDVEARMNAKVKGHNTLRSSLKSSAVNLTMGLRMKTGKKSRATQVQQLFHLDQARSASVKETFNFRPGITSRPITLSFTVTLE